MGISYIKKFDIIFLIGSPGSGKTTIIKQIAPNSLNGFSKTVDPNTGRVIEVFDDFSFYIANNFEESNKYMNMLRSSIAASRHTGNQIIASLLMLPDPRYVGYRLVRLFNMLLSPVINKRYTSMFYEQMGRPKPAFVFTSSEPELLKKSPIPISRRYRNMFSHRWLRLLDSKPLSRKTRPYMTVSPFGVKIGRYGVKHV